jgi:hypothetical protein
MKIVIVILLAAISYSKNTIAQTTFADNRTSLLSSCINYSINNDITFKKDGSLGMGCNGDIARKLYDALGTLGNTTDITVGNNSRARLRMMHSDVNGNPTGCYNYYQLPDGSAASGFACYLFLYIGPFIK